MSSISVRPSTLRFAVRSLTRRERPAQILDELENLVGQEWPNICRRVTEHAAPLQMSKEALVSVLRFYLQQGERNKADYVFLQLIKRLSGAIANKLAKWSSIAGMDMEDTRQNVLLGLHEYFYSLEPGEELWECNFKTCFDMRLITLLSKFARAKAPTVSMNAEVEDDGDVLAPYEFPDPSSSSQYERVEVVDALKHLHGVNPNLGKVFYLKFFSDLPEREIAKMLDVHERTIRNWIVSSRKVLQQYYAEL